MSQLVCIRFLIILLLYLTKRPKTIGDLGIMDIYNFKKSECLKTCNVVACVHDEIILVT